MPGHLFECNPRMKSQHEGTLSPWLHPPEKAACSKYNSTSGLTPHEPLERQSEFCASTQEEARLPGSNSTETPRWMSEMERNPDFPTSTRDEVLFIPVAIHEESQSAPSNVKGDLTSLRRHEQVPQVNTQLERNPKLPTTSPRKPQNSPMHA